MPWSLLFRFGLPFIFILGVVWYITNLQSKNDHLQQANERLTLDLGRAMSAAEEQREENQKLRKDIAKANEGKALADQALNINRLSYEERIDVIQKSAVLLEKVALANAHIAGNDANRWFTDWMQQIARIATPHRDNPDGKKVSLAAIKSTDTPNTNRAILVGINSSYAEQMQEQCDESRWDEDGLVDDSLSGDPKYCNWYAIAVSGERWPEVQLYLERVLLFAEDLWIWGKYHKDATDLFSNLDSKPNDN